ncbi:MAG: DUF1178 family protein [Alphaproteobacteria bacterium]|nr:DUF1178 family protein [Alphaproteobacteria bacterium]
MIRFSLVCGKGHQFDEWFFDIEDYDAKLALNELTCPECGDKKIGHNHQTRDRKEPEEYGMRTQKVPELAKLRVLVVDDNEYILRLVRMVLNDLGVAYCMAARNADEAKKIIRQSGTGINLVICDWNMPGETGVELLHELRADGVTYPFIMLTVRADEGSVVRAREDGVSAYLVKPFAPLQLEKKLRALAEMIPSPPPSPVPKAPGAGHLKSKPINGTD